MNKRKHGDLKKEITTFKNSNLIEPEIPVVRKAKMSFKCPISIDTVFKLDSINPKDVKLFYESRNNLTPFKDLGTGCFNKWKESYIDNRIFIGFIIYSQVFPMLLKTRIKLNSPSYHYSVLDDKTDRGGIKLSERLYASNRLKKMVTDTLFMGVKSIESKNVLEFMNIDFDEEDERYRFFTKREFSMIYSSRGTVGSSSVYTSCSIILNLLWFCVCVLGRPVSLQSIILPITVTEREILENRFRCPCEFFDGAIKGYITNWGSEVFSVISSAWEHKNIDYLILDTSTSRRYIENLFPADAYSVFKATMSTSDLDTIRNLVSSYKINCKHGVDSGAIVGVFDVLKDKADEMIGTLDERDLGSIFVTFGEKACLDVKNETHKFNTMFDLCISNKISGIVSHLDKVNWSIRKRTKLEMNIKSNMDPAGITKKIECQEMLDPRDPESTEKMLFMLKSLCGQVWKPLKSIIDDLDETLVNPILFLQLCDSRFDELYRHMVLSGVKYSDIANLYIILVLSFSYQRSQVIRQSTVDEFTLVPDKSKYKLDFKRRRFKTSISGGKGSSLPVSHFELSSQQSMIVKFISCIGHKFTNLESFDQTRNLLLNSSGENWTQYDISSRVKYIGIQWLGISNFSMHRCRTFWSTSALENGQIDSSNIDDFSSFLQVSTKTMQNSYMSASANSTAHKVGLHVLGKVSNAACIGDVSEKGSRPFGKKLNAKRLIFVDLIKTSLVQVPMPRKLFRELVYKRDCGTLGVGEQWFAWDNTYFHDDDERLFVRFVSNISK